VDRHAAIERSLDSQVGADLAALDEDVIQPDGEPCAAPPEGRVVVHRARDRDDGTIGPGRKADDRSQRGARDTQQQRRDREPGDDSQAATCLNLGADAWLPDETSTGVIAAQLRRLLQTSPGRAAPSPRLAAGNVMIDTGERRVTLNGNELELAPREYELLRVMAENRGRALSRDRILAAAWGPRFVGEPKTVDVHVAWLRQKLDGSGLRVTTIRGLGYRLDVMPVSVPDKPVAAVGAMGRSTSTGP